MKKWLLVLLALLVLFTALAYILIPSTLTVSAVTTASCTKNELTTCLHNPKKWLYWIPDSNANAPSVLAQQSFKASGYTYTLRENLLNGASFTLQHDGLTLPVAFEALSLHADSVAVQAQTSLEVSRNPFTRVFQYFEAVGIHKNLQELLHRLTATAVQPAKVYGFPIFRGGFDDSLLISTRILVTAYPDVSTIYRVVDGLRLYARAQAAKETDGPMFHVLQTDSSHYELMAAVPIDRQIAETKDYHLVRMVHVNGKYVQAEVKGGPSTLKEAHRQIDNFMLDHSLTSPGIPFEIMVTDRSLEADTAKWVTRVYHPST
jgi:hypothetical protein